MMAFEQPEQLEKTDSVCIIMHCTQNREKHPCPASSSAKEPSHVLSIIPINSPTFLVVVARDEAVITPFKLTRRA